MAAGDHIKVQRMGGLYTHHGIDMGDGFVVHFSGEPLQGIEAEVRRDSLEDFLQGGEVEVVPYPAETVLSVQEVLSLAQARVGERNYNLWRNNCEHFASYCKLGYQHSSQVRRIVGAACTMAVGGALIGGATLMAALRQRRRRRGGIRS